MEWSKLKNIILIILLALNGALLLLIGGPKVSAYAREVQAGREAVAFLEQKGIQLRVESVPNSADTQPQLAQRDLETEKKLAQQLLGPDAAQESRGGEVYRYESAAGMVQFHSDGTFWAELEPQAFPLNGSGETAALLALEQLGFSGEVVEREKYAVTVRQNWGGAALLNQRATVLWNDRGITQITAGRRLYGTPVEDTDRRSVDKATALIDFYNGLNRLGDVCSRVDAITPGYLSAPSLNKVMTLTPVWRVTTDTGAYQLDLVTGELDRVD